ncbi:hypothetical protein P0D88_34885 [Paraburkholderia sp. RL18-103-BIB-C]
MCKALCRHVWRVFREHGAQRVGEGLRALVHRYDFVFYVLHFLDSL